MSQPRKSMSGTARRVSDARSFSESNRRASQSKVQPDKNGFVKPFQKGSGASQTFEEDEDPSASSSRLSKVRESEADPSLPEDDNLLTYKQYVKLSGSQFESLQNALSDSIENSQLELKNFMTELGEKFSQIAASNFQVLKEDVLVESSKELSQLRADIDQFRSGIPSGQTSDSQLSAMHDELRSLYQSTCSQVVSEMQKQALEITGEVQKIRIQEEDLRPVIQKIDDLQSHVGRAGGQTHAEQNLENENVSNVDPQPLLNKMDNVQASILSEVEANHENLVATMTSKLQAFEAARFQEGLPIDAPDLKVGFDPVLQEISVLRSDLQANKIEEEKRMAALDSQVATTQENINIIAQKMLDTKHENLLEQLITNLASTVQNLTSTNVGLAPLQQEISLLRGDFQKCKIQEEERLAAVDSKMDKSLDSKLASMLEALENAKVLEEGSLPAMNTNDTFDSNVGLAPLLQEVRVLRGDFQKFKMHEEERIAAVDSKMEKSLDPVLQRIMALGSQLERNQDTLVTHLSTKHESLLGQLGTKLASMLEALENAKVREEETLPVMNRNDTFDSNVGMATAIAALEKNIEKVQAYEEDLLPLLRHIDGLCDKLDLEPMLALLQQILVRTVTLDASCLNPVIQKIEDAQAAIMMQMSAEVKNLPDAVVQMSDSMRKSIDSLDCNLRESISGLQTDQNKLSDKVVQMSDSMRGSIDSLDCNLRESISGLQTDQNKLSPVLSEVVGQCGTICTHIDKELAAVRETIQRSQGPANGCELDLAPVLSKIDMMTCMMVEQAFFSPVLSKMDIELAAVRETIQKSQGPANGCELDLAPVLSKLDMMVDQAFISPVLNKMDAVENNILAHVIWHLANAEEIGKWRRRKGPGDAEETQESRAPEAISGTESERNVAAVVLIQEDKADAAAGAAVTVKEPAAEAAKPAAQQQHLQKQHQQRCGSAPPRSSAMLPPLTEQEQKTRPRCPQDTQQQETFKPRYDFGKVERKLEELANIRRHKQESL